MRQHSIQSAVRRLTLLARSCRRECHAGQRTKDARFGQARRAADRRERETERKRDPKEILVEVNEDLSRLNALNEGSLDNGGYQYSAAKLTKT